MQSGHEKTLTALLPAMAGANVIYGLGMLESGMTMNFGQLVADNEMAKMIKRVIQGISINDATLAVDVISKVGASGNYIIEKHTREYMKTEQTYPKLMDRNFRGKWEAEGSKDLYEKAAEEARNILQNHVPDPLSDEVKAELSEIIKEAEIEMNTRAKR
jgi:trimethylamine--corrinoid protein Co-methyltransferase